MKTWIMTLAAMVVAGTTAGETWAHERCQADYYTMLDGWYRSYLRRPADRFGIRFWGERLVQGESPLWVEAQILGSNEYFISRAGSCPRAFVQSLYLDVTGSPACPVITERLVCRLRDTGCRDVVAREVLLEARTAPHAPVVVVERPPLVAPVVVARPPLPPLPPRPVPAAFHRHGHGPRAPLPPLPPVHPVGSSRPTFGISIRFGR